MQLHSEARGMTPWARLQNYNVKFDYSVNVVVQMDVHRETGDLLPNELKLVVMQVSARPPAPSLVAVGAGYVIGALPPMWCDNISEAQRETTTVVEGSTSPP